jgi:hypothetical protein
LTIGKRPPADYLAEVAEKHPGALESQWIPMDNNLWKTDRYLDFLAARRELLARAANDFLRQLRDGVKPAGEPLHPIGVVAEEDIEDDRARMIKDLITDLTALGCVVPDIDAEIPDPDTGAVLAVAEAFWPDGLQPGLGGPVVLELDAGSDLARMSELGYQVFTSADSLRGFVVRRNEESAGDGSVGGDVPAAAQ